MGGPGRLTGVGRAGSSEPSHPAGFTSGGAKNEIVVEPLAEPEAIAAPLARSGT